MANAQTTDLLATFITAITTPATSLKLVLEGSYQAVKIYPCAFVNVNSDEEVRVYASQRVHDTRETITVLVVAKTVNDVRYAMEEILKLTTSASLRTSLGAYGAFDIKSGPRNMPMKINPKSNDEYGGEIELTMQVRYIAS